jgi:L-threonylcarbamoyladenylate synthase
VPNIIPTQPIELLEKAVRQAVALLTNGELVALPTETVYGLAANATNEIAVKKIYLAKGRPSNNPIIVHVSDIEMARNCVSDWTDEAETLANFFWPGPLSIVLKRSKIIPDAVTGGGDTVAVRCPQHPVFQSVIRTCRFPLAAPSANRSNHISPTTANHVFQSLGDNVSLILDGGACEVGIESTVVDLTVPQLPKILRPGMISEESILSALSSIKKPHDNIMPFSSVDSINEKMPLKSPGQLKRHYSPSVPLYLLNINSEIDVSNFIKERGFSVGSCALISMDIFSNTHFAINICIGRDPSSYAKQIYSALYRSDQEGISAIILQNPPDLPEWRGIRDRIKRAAAR